MIPPEENVPTLNEVLENFTQKNNRLLSRKKTALKSLVSFGRLRNRNLITRFDEGIIIPFT